MSLVEPGFEDFEERYRLGAAQVVWTRLVADLETPVSAMLKLAAGRPNSFLFELVEGGAVRGRYSMLGFAPDVVFRARGDEAEINRRAETDADAFEPCAEKTLAALRRLIGDSHIDLPEGLPPMAAGVFGYMGYDTVRLMEDLPSPNPDALGVPDAIFIRPTVTVIFDAVKDEVTVVTPVRPLADLSAKAAYARAIDRINDVVDGLDRHVEKAPAAEEDALSTDAPASNTSPDEYKAMVGRAKEYIAAGDIFQVVLSASASRRRSRCRPSRSTGRFGASIPSPFLFYLDFGDSPSSGRARKSWCACAKARSPSGPSPAPASAARRRREDKA